MILTKEGIATIKYYIEKDSGLNYRDTFNMLETIEAQSATIQQLQAKVEKCREAHVRILAECVFADATEYQRVEDIINWLALEALKEEYPRTTPNQ